MYLTQMNSPRSCCVYPSHATGNASQAWRCVAWRGVVWRDVVWLGMA